MRGRSQDLAPNLMADEFLTVSIAAGTTPFASSGSYKFFTSVAGTNYTILGNAGTGLSTGTYSYAKTGPNTGVMELMDAQGGPPISLQITFASTNAGSLGIANGTGTQTGAFVATNYAQITSPNLFLSKLVNGQFQTFLSGQPGFDYLIQAAADAVNWIDWTNLPVGNLTTNFGSPIGPETAAFYRAKIQATPFAPVLATNQTFNLTITGGALPLPTNGIVQFMTLTNNGFQILGGPGLPNGAGSYAYTRTGDASGVFNYTDSTAAGSYVMSLFFTSPNTGHFYLTGTGGFEAGKFMMTDGPAEFLGNVGFVPDATRRSSGLFPANGQPLTLTVTDAGGYVWQLALPGDALLTPRLISVTPFGNIDSSQTWLRVASGVQLEPDGMQFSDAVTLTVTPPDALGANATLVMAQDDGSALHFVAESSQNNVYTTQLAHFTSAGISNPSSQQQAAFGNQYSAVAQAAYMTALIDVQLLESRQEMPPEPPDFDLSCDPNGSAVADSLADLYVSGLFLEESDAIEKLTLAAQILYASTGDPSVLVTAMLEPARLVESSEYFKVNSLFNNYGMDPKKFIPVVKAAQAAELQDLLHGGSERDFFSDRIEAAGNTARDYYFQKLTQEHDYSVITPLFEIEQLLDTLGVGDNATFDQMLDNALTFELMLDIKLSSSDGGEEAQGTITLNTGANNFPCTGSGTMNYVSGNVGPATLAPVQSFSLTASIDNVDACEGMTISIIFNQFSADMDTFTFMGQDVSLPSPLGESAKAVFQANLQTSGPYAGLYSFPAMLQNMNAEAVNQTFTGQGQGGSVSVNAVLLHTPQ